jgi:urate oxidase
VTTNGLQTSVVSGIQQLGLMRSSGFLSGHPPARADDGTEDAIAALVAGTLAARWSYSTSDVAFGPARRGVRDAIVETFAMHAARSVQFTLYAIADVVLGAYPEILDVTVAFEERRYDPADPFGASGGPEDLFVPADGTVRTVEVTVARDPA